MTKFFNLLTNGLALGAVYSLVALGFVVIYRATRVINFAQGGLVVFGAFLVYQAEHTWHWDFWIAAVFAMACCAGIGAAFQVAVLRRMIGQPIFAVILITIGLFLLVEPITTTIWHNPPGGIETPWHLKTVSVGDVKILQVNIATIVMGIVVFGAFFLLGMRCTRSLETPSARSSLTSWSRIWSSMKRPITRQLMRKVSSSAVSAESLRTMPRNTLPLSPYLSATDAMNSMVPARASTSAGAKA